MLSRDQEYLKHLTQLTWCLVLCAISLLTGSCNTTQYLKPGEKQLVKNKVVIQKERGQSLPPNLNYNLTTLYKQKPNSSWAFIPSERIYAKNQERIAKGKRSKAWREKRGEPIAVYQEELTRETRQSMVYYLNNQGYFEADVGYEVLPKNEHGIAVKYIVRPGKQFVVEEYVFTSRDEKIDAILQHIAGQSKLRGTKRLSNDLFTLEYARIVSHLKNNGYAKIDQTYFRAEGDSTGHQVKVKVEVLPPRDRPEHQLYKVGTINVFPEYFPSVKQPSSRDTLIQGIHFKTLNNKFRIKPETILRNIFIKEDMLYDQRLVSKTQTQLNNLNAFRAISVQPHEREDSSGIMDFDIYLTPRKKLSYQMDLEVNNSSNNIAGDRTNLIGTALRTNFKNYNSFKNATIFDLSLGGGVEFNLSNIESLIFSADASANLGLAFPRFIKWIGPYGLLNSMPIGRDSLGVRKKMLSNRAYNLIREKAKTRFDIGYEYVDIFRFYEYHSLEMNLGYDIPLNRNTNLNISQTGLTFFRPNIEVDFMDILDNNPFLQRTFTKQLFTGFFLRDISYSYTSSVNRFGENWGFLAEFDLSGLEMYAVNKIYNGIKNNQDTLRLSGDIDYSQFIKLQLFSNYTRNFGSESAVAFRLNVGVAQPFGFSRGEGVPYVEQFSGGGPYSMRSWILRELGPGGYIQPDPADENIVFFQTGDFKFEGNAELRFPLFWYLKGAVFLDIGNIWTIRYDESRVNSQFRFSAGKDENGNELTPFFEQLAIGSGVGIRMDVNYFIVRLDLGIKLRNPYPVNGSYWLPDRLGFNFFQDVNPNIAIGYPF